MLPRPNTPTAGPPLPCRLPAPRSRQRWSGRGSSSSLRTCRRRWGREGVEKGSQQTQGRGVQQHCTHLGSVCMHAADNSSSSSSSASSVIFLFQYSTRRSTPTRPPAPLAGAAGGGARAAGSTAGGAGRLFGARSPEAGGLGAAGAWFVAALLPGWQPHRAGALWHITPTRAAGVWALGGSVQRGFNHASSVPCFLAQLPPSLV